MEEKIIWQDYEHHHYERSSDWYWSVGIISGSIIIASVIFGNWLFGILIFLAIFSIVLQINKRPKIFTFELNKKGLIIEKTLYSYENLESFFISENETDKKLFFQSKKVIMPLIIIPVKNVDHDKVESFLLKHVEKKETHEPVLQKVAEYFGF